MTDPKLLENVRKTVSGEVVIVKRPKDINIHTQNLSLTFAEYEYLVSNHVDRFEIVMFGRKSKKVQWDKRFLEYAEFRGYYYLVPYSDKSKMVKRKLHEQA